MMASIDMVEPCSNGIIKWNHISQIITLQWRWWKLKNDVISIELLSSPPQPLPPPVLTLMTSVVDQDLYIIDTRQNCIHLWVKWKINKILIIHRKFSNTQNIIFFSSTFTCHEETAVQYGLDQYILTSLTKMTSKQNLECFYKNCWVIYHTLQVKIFM